MPKETKQEKPWWADGITFFYQITGWIVSPVIFGLFLGKFLDERYGTEPRYLIICIGIAFVITNIGLLLETLKYHKRLKKINNNEEKHEIHKK